MARAEALRVLSEVAKGADPASVRSAAKAAPTVTEFAARFLAERAEAKRKPRTAREYRRLIEKIILPALRQRLPTSPGRISPDCIMPGAQHLSRPIERWRCSRCYSHSWSAKASARTAPILVGMSSGSLSDVASDFCRAASLRGLAMCWRLTGALRTTWQQSSCWSSLARSAYNGLDRF